jgi:hypothetical protein
MKKLQVLGAGCPKCLELAKRTDEAAKAAGLDYELEKAPSSPRSCPSAYS